MTTTTHTHAPTIRPSELNEMIARGQSITLIDVRTGGEFETLHARGARNVPLDRLNARDFLEQRASTTEPIYVICQSGSRAAKACRAFHDAGFESAINVEGGTEAWQRAGLPTERGSRRVISLQRQVFIGAGTLIVLGAALGVTVSPWFYALDAFVGCGLLFAGLTDICAMQILLSKMPWNQGS